MQRRHGKSRLALSTAVFNADSVTIAKIRGHADQAALEWGSVPGEFILSS